MAATIEKMLQQQIDLIQELSKAMKDIIDACEFFNDQNENLNMRLYAYQEEFAEISKRMGSLEAQNIKLMRTFSKIKNELKYLI